MNVPEHEAAFLREHYVSHGSDFCAQALGLTWRQVQRRTHALGLRRTSRWTRADDDKLRFVWGALSLNMVAKRMGRTPAACYWRAKILGLGLGCPRGYVYLGHLAEEAGFSRDSLRRILRWAGVGVLQGPKNPTSKKRGRGLVDYKTWVVDHVEGLEAVERWLEAETVFAASKRIGVGVETLERWLRDDGRAGERPRKKAHWRVSAALVDEVASAHLKVAA